MASATHLLYPHSIGPPALQCLFERPFCLVTLHCLLCWSSAASSSGTMLAMLLVSLISSFVLLCLVIPSVRTSLMAVDETLDAHEAGLAMVASRESDRAVCSCLGLILVLGKPFRESGPPQNMAQLIMLRRKVCLLLSLSVSQLTQLPDAPI